MTTTEANQRIVADIKVLARDAEELLRATAGEAGEKIKEVRQRLAQALESAREKYEDLGDQTAEKLKAVDETIRDHPYETIGVAFGVGVILGILVGRR